MEVPNVCNTMLHPESNVTYQIMAYRQLTHAEMIREIRAYLATRKGKAPPKNKTITTTTEIGA